MGDVETVETEKYIRKPLYVDAVRVTPQNFDAIATWCQGEILDEEVGDSGVTKKYIKVRVHNPKNPRQTKAFVGDWILYTERGYKVYTNKAFRGAFDLVEDAEPKLETETPTRLGNVSHTPEEKDQLAVQQLDQPLSEDEEAITAEELEGLSLETGQPVESAVDDHTTPQGEPHEYVKATPETIAEAVNDREVPVDPALLEDVPAPGAPIVPPEASPEPVSEQAPEEAAAGKRVLSEEEQRQLGPDEVQALVRTGEVILAQDLETEVR